MNCTLNFRITPEAIIDGQKITLSNKIETGRIYWLSLKLRDEYGIDMPIQKLRRWAKKGTIIAADIDSLDFWDGKAGQMVKRKLTRENEICVKIEELER